MLSLKILKINAINILNIIKINKLAIKIVAGPQIYSDNWVNTLETLVNTHQVRISVNRSYTQETKLVNQYRIDLTILIQAEIISQIELKKPEIVFHTFEIAWAVSDRIAISEK